MKITKMNHELRQLSDLPRDVWVGLPVYHPQSQYGTECNWATYDIGVVVKVEPDPDFADDGVWRVTFHGSCGPRSWTLYYGADNLWVPRQLADRISACKD